MLFREDPDVFKALHTVRGLGSGEVGMGIFAEGILEKGYARGRADLLIVDRSEEHRQSVDGFYM